MSSIDHRQQEGVAWDIIDEAIGSFDEWMKDDDFDAMRVLHEIVGRMRERMALYRDRPAQIRPCPVCNSIGTHTWNCSLNQR